MRTRKKSGRPERTVSRTTGIASGKTPRLVSEPDLQDRVCMALEAGAPFKDACRSNQLDETLAYDWIRKADDEGVARCYGEFRDAVRRAIARGNVRLVTNIARAAQREEVQRTSATCPACGHTHEVAVRVTLPNDFRAAVQLLKWRDPESYPSDRFISEMRFAGDPGAMAQIQIYIPAKDGGEPQLTGG